MISSAAWIWLALLPAAGNSELPAALQSRIERAIAEFRPYEKRTPPSVTGNAAESEDGELSRQAASKTQRLARTIWPEGDLPTDRTEWFCDMFARLAVTNRSIVYFMPQTTIEDGVVVLRGATNAPSVVEGLVRALRAVGIEHVRNEMRILPDRERLKNRLFGACRVKSVRTYSAPVGRSGAQTELLYGEPVRLLDVSEQSAEDAHFLVHAEDGYWGWAPQSAIETMDDDRFASYMGHRRAAVLQNVSTHGVEIPRASVLPILATERDACRLLRPDGKELRLPATLVRLEPEIEQSVVAEIEAALDLLRVPYVFGGRSPDGLDCSGLMTHVATHAGLAWARDAWQQAFIGRLTATWWHRGGLQAGDQVFFIDASGKIYHTGIAISPTHVLHAAPPGVQIGSFNKGDRLYDPRVDLDFFIAKRR